MSTDIVLCTVPYIEFDLPPSASATLKGHLQSKGFKVKTLDLNIMLKEFFSDNQKELKEVSELFIKSICACKPVPLRYELSSKALENKLDKLVSLWCKVILETNPKWIGLSVFSRDSRVACKLLCKKLATIEHTSKILIGGCGIENNEFLEDIQPLIDVYIQGEGELVLENLLKGNLNFKGINGKANSIEDLDALGVPDYDDYNLSSYNQFYEDEDVVMITASRGCVRDCKFCDPSSLWATFKWRSGKHIVEEITKIYETKGVKHFYFTDNLINGDMKSYMDMVGRLADYNYKTGAGIKWGGFYVPIKKNDIPKDYFSLTSASGAYNLALGVESGSNSVLKHMQKQFTIDDLDNFIENFSQHNIKCSYMLIIGYPTETDADYEQTLDLFYKHQKYVADGTILGATLGSTLAIYPGMPLWKERGTLIELDESNKIDPRIGWTSKVVPHLNWEERLKRRMTAEEVCKMLKWPLTSSLRELSIVRNANEYHKTWKQGTLKTNTKRVVSQNYTVQV